MRFRKKSFEISIDVYMTKVFVSFGDVEGLKEVLRATEYAPDEGGIESIIKSVVGSDREFDGIVVPLENRYHVMYIPRRLEKRYLLSVINHEVFHVVHGILRDVGMVLTDESQEAYAYLNGYINKKIYEQLQ